MRVNWTASVCAAGLLVGAGCGSSSEDPTDAGDAATAEDGVGAGDTKSDTSVAGDTKQDTTTGSETAGGDIAVDVGTAPTQSTVEAHVAGRLGNDLKVTLVGEDPDIDVVGVQIRTLDSAGASLLTFTTTTSGVADSDTATLPLDGPATTKSFVGAVTMHGMALEFPTIAKLEVALVDSAGNLSPTDTVAVTAQLVKAVGEPCDPTYVDSRCQPSYGCSGTPAICSEGAAPTIDKLAYHVDDKGSRILIAGAEPEDDVAKVHMEFLDASAKPVMADMDGDGTPDSESYDFDITGKSLDGMYFARFDQSGTFSVDVPQIGVTVIDSAGHESARKTAKETKPIMKGAGGTCDPRGFEQCNPTSAVCVPGPKVGVGSCKPVATLRTAKCADAPLLELDKGTVTTSGNAFGVGVWDPPAGCSAGDSTGRPEGAVRLRLGSVATKLTITTNIDGTNFDTIVYVFNQCGADNTPLVCADDTDTGTSTSGAGSVVMEMVSPGDYLVVIDAWSAEGGAYALSITAE